MGDSSMIARHLFDVEWLLVVSPVFLYEVAPITSPADLTNLAAITTAVDPSRVTWHLGSGDEETSLRPKVTMQVNDLRIAANMDELSARVAEAARAGLGIARLPQLLVQQELDDGDLVELLPDWRRPPVPVQLVYQRRRLLTAAQTAFIDFALQRMVTDQSA